MATKYQLITDLYESTIKKVTNSPTTWTAFLRSACRNYKCRFDEQILIYSQRPDAIAVLEIEKWNEQFGRWVNRGARGIAVFDDEYNHGYRLKHYFDISDTHGSRFERPVPLWNMKPEYESEVIESLENSFGDFDDKSTLAKALISAARNAVEDNIYDYLHDLINSCKDSFLEELDDFNVEVKYRLALENSVAYMLLIRCGLDADKYFDFDDLLYIIDFNTNQTANALGIATSDISEMCLREIAATVLNLNRTFALQGMPIYNVFNEQNDERSFEYGRNIDLSDGGRLSSAESDRAGGNARNPWQIRIAPQEIPQTEPQDLVSEPIDRGNTIQPPYGNRADSQRENGIDDSANGNRAERDRTDESRESNAMGGIDEQYPALGGGSNTERPNIHIKPLPTQLQQLSFWDEAEENESSAFSIPIMQELPQVELPIEDNTPNQPQEEALTPAWEKPNPQKRTHIFDAHPEIPMSDRHNYRITDNDLGVGGQKTKFKNNVEAIKSLQAIERENRFAMPEEQEILARYVGWGGLPQAFDPDNNQWTNEYLELNSLLPSEEYASARASTLNAHYTSPTVINAIYKAAENMGFKNGNVLEPSCGIGNFFGLLPESMIESKLFGVELDSVTGRIARQLYQKNSIAIQGFETTELPDSFFDLAIGNVPFGEYQVADKRYDKHKFLIHDYFFARTLDKVRPGGIVAFVTSKGTLDKQNPSVRKYIAQRAELLGAIRLPNNAFYRNANTQVTTDIIFLQKRDRMIDIEPSWVHLGKTETGIPVNSYFVEHSEMILGEMVFDDGMYGNQKDTTCTPLPDSNLAEQLAEAITNIHAEIAEYEHDEDTPEEDNSVPADPNVRNFSYAIVDGQIYYRQDSRMIPAEMPITAQNRVRGLIELRECVRNLIMYQTEDYPDGNIRAEQTKLNRLYDNFIKKYGLINSRGNSMAFSQDSAYCLLCSLEIIDENGELERKADMFIKRTIKPHVPITHVDTASEALAVSMSEKARVDISYMAELSGIEPQIILKELEGIIFQIPRQGEPTWVTADEYLSGNVREKLKSAKEYAVQYPEFSVNVRALEAALPPDLTAAEISVRLGATWLPEDVIEHFMYELLQPSYYARNHIKIHYSQHTGEWNIAEKNADRSNIHSFNTYGTQRINAYKIIEDSLNLRDVRIFDKIIDADGNEKRVLNKKETAIAQAKQELIRSKFEEWIWSAPDRRERLCRIYNDAFNSIRPREYDGSHIKFVGMNPEITLRKHQIDAIAHILYGGNTLLAHEVGAGKTYEMIAAAMESKRLGLCNKSLIVVPNHITEQWSGEFLQLYPSANILVATKKDFETKNRKKFCARIATGDYDAVIIGHSQFEKIPMSVERQERMLEQQIDELVDAIDEIKRNKGERYTIKQMERLKKSLEIRLAKLNDQSRKDNVVTFEELGVDRLFVDEAHYYKEL